MAHFRFEALIIGAFLAEHPAEVGEGGDPEIVKFLFVDETFLLAFAGLRRQNMLSRLDDCCELGNKLVLIFHGTLSLFYRFVNFAVVLFLPHILGYGKLITCRLARGEINVGCNAGFSAGCRLSLARQEFQGGVVFQGFEDEGGLDVLDSRDP
ncbi:MAG: hypothetical protein ACD_75C02599G0003 [uncultured bacterium]|nr:MAG: hypothetical protein ACD_75C02599G0003 [uncultured bacterium]